MTDTTEIESKADTIEVQFTPDMLRYVEQQGLMPATDPEAETTVYRRPGFEGVVPLAEFEARVGSWLKNTRSLTGLSQQEFGQFLGLTKIAYGRYERGFTKLTLSRFVAICEILDADPVDAFYAVAPHLFGKSAEISSLRRDLVSKINTMDDTTLQALNQMLTSIEAMKVPAK